ncbi:MAG: hypothetical protein ABSB76_21530 [Streptosporangiaceae bacterium]|jgi:hypothetical protein
MTRTSTQDLQEDFLTALRKGQQTMISALRIWVETVQAVTPKLSGVYAPLTDKLPQLPNVGVSSADKLPSPKEAVDSAYGLAEELLANQRKFAEAVLETTAPLMPGHQHNGRSRVTLKVAPKPLAFKTEPKPAETWAAAVVPAPQRVVVKPEPKAAVEAKPEPKAAVVAKPEPKAEVVATPPKPPVATTSAPKPAAPKAEEPKPAAPKAEEPKPAAPKAEEPKPAAPKAAPRKAAAPKAAAPKAAPRKAAPRKAAAPKAAAPKAAAPRAKATDAS